MESLETRSLMAGDATMSLSDGLLKIVGTEYADTVSITKTRNGVEVYTGTEWKDGPLGGGSSNIRTFKGKINRIEIRTYDGNDKITIDNALNSYSVAEVFAGIGNDTVNGGGGRDVIWGDKGDDVLRGRDGNDELHGYYGNDTLVGGKGTDWIHGGADEDDIWGNSAVDTLIGGSGTDKIHLDLADAAGDGKWTKSTPKLSLAATLDLTDSRVADAVEDKLSALAQGNESSASVDSLSVDLNTGDVSGSFTVRHRHVWKKYGQTVVVYDDKMHGDFRYNVYSGEIRGDLDLGRGAKVSLHDLYKVMQGDLTPIYANALAARQRSAYDSVVDSLRDQHGKSNVYFASKSFVDWAGPETIVRWGAEAVLSDGASLSTVPNEVANKLRAELTGITNWLKSRVSDGTEKQLANKLVEALASRKNIDTPFFKVEWKKVSYWYESALVSGIRTQSIDHAAYALILKV